MNAIVSSEGLAVYANGEWREGWKDKTIRVAFSEFLATTDRVSYGMHNPFIAWNDTDRLLDSERIDSEWAYTVLMEEAASNAGHLVVDTRAYFVNAPYDGSVSDKLPAPLSADELTAAQKPAAVSGLTENGTAQPLVVPPAGPSPDTYVLLYSTDGGLTWSERVPAMREAGIYTVKAKYVSDVYEDIVLDDITVIIRPAQRPEGRPAVPAAGSVTFPILPFPQIQPPVKKDDVPQAPVTGTPAAENADLPFIDVVPGMEQYDAVRYVYENGIMNGISDTLFDPFGTLTRGMMVTILYRIEGEPEVAYNGTFTDVPDGKWFSDGVEWAASTGIVNGYGDGTFGPADEVTREQLAAILYRYAVCKGFEIKTAGFLPDGNISPWAVDYVNWAAANGVLQVSGGTVRAVETALRWEVAAAIRGFCENAAK